MNKFIVGFGTAPQEYVINGVCEIGLSIGKNIIDLLGIRHGNTA